MGVGAYEKTTSSGKLSPGLRPDMVRAKGTVLNVMGFVQVQKRDRTWRVSKGHRVNTYLWYVLGTGVGTKMSESTGFLVQVRVRANSTATL